MRTSTDQAPGAPNEEDGQGSQFGNSERKALLSETPSETGPVGKAPRTGPRVLPTTMEAAAVLGSPLHPIPPQRQPRSTWISLGKPSNEP